LNVEFNFVTTTNQMDNNIDAQMNARGKRLKPATQVFNVFLILFYLYTND